MAAELSKTDNLGFKKNHNNNNTVKDTHQAVKQPSGTAKRSYPFTEGAHPLDLSTKRAKTMSPNSRHSHTDNGLDLSASSKHFSTQGVNSSAKFPVKTSSQSPFGKQQCVGDGIQVFQNTILNWDVDEVVELIKEVDGCVPYVPVSFVFI